MHELPASLATIASASHLTDALAYLEARGFLVEIDDMPSVYCIGSERFTDGELIAFAARIMPLGLGRVP